jgi:hypothetical protein
VTTLTTSSPTRVTSFVLSKPVRYSTFTGAETRKVDTPSRAS